MQGSSLAASRFVLTAVGHIQRLSACGTGFRKCGSFVRGWSGLHGLRHPLVCKWPITATSIQVLSRLAGRDRFPVTQHAGSGGFPARGRHFSRNAGHCLIGLYSLSPEFGCVPAHSQDGGSRTRAPKHGSKQINQSEGLQRWTQRMIATLKVSITRFPGADSWKLVRPPRSPRPEYYWPAPLAVSRQHLG